MNTVTTVVPFEGREAVEDYLSSLNSPSNCVRLEDTWAHDQRYFFEMAEGVQATTSVAVAFDLYDDIAHTSDVIRQISDSCFSEKPEVVLAVNADWPEDAFLSTENARHTERYERIVSHIGSNLAQFENVLVRTFFTHIPNRNMNLVHRTAVGSIVMDSIARRSANYPILRYDADGTYIAPGTIDEHAEEVRNSPGILVKVPTVFRYPSMHYTYDNTHGYREFVRDDPTLTTNREQSARVIAGVYGLAKDIIESQLGPTEERTYHEESGSGAQLETWMQVLAIDQKQDPKGLAYGGTGENRTFLRIAKTCLRQDSPFYYLDKSVASHETSSRRIQRLASQIHPALIPVWEGGEAYETHVELARQQVENRPRRHSIEDIMTMVGVMLLRQEAVSGRPVQLPRVEKMKLASLIQASKFHQDNRHADLRVNGATPQHRWNQDRRKPLEEYGDWVAAAQIMAQRFLMEIETPPSSALT